MITKVWDGLTKTHKRLGQKSKPSFYDLNELIDELRATQQALLEFFNPIQSLFSVRRDTVTGRPVIFLNEEPYDVTKYYPSGGTTYYVYQSTGNDSNDGLTQGTALKSVAAAITKTNALTSGYGTILMEPTTFFRNFGTFSTSPTRSVTIKSNGGRTTIGAHDGLTWTVNDAPTATYQATRSSVGGVFDKSWLDANSEYSRLTSYASLALLKAADVSTVGGWYTDNVTVYVRLRAARVPDTNVRAYLTGVRCAQVSGAITVAFENIDMEGGSTVLEILTLATVYAKGCTFKYATATNGVTVQGANTVFVNCTAALNALDGFNYHAVESNPLEINCIGRTNGFLGGDINNGSTVHDGITVLRINGTYHGNNGPNIADVNNAKSWLVGCEAFNSTGAAGQNANYVIDGSMWLDTCRSYGSTYDLYPQQVGSTIYTRNYQGGNSFFIVGNRPLTY